MRLFSICVCTYPIYDYVIHPLARGDYILCVSCLLSCLCRQATVAMTNDASSIPNTDFAVVLIHGLRSSISFPVTTMLSLAAYGGTRTQSIFNTPHCATQKKQKNSHAQPTILVLI